MKTIISRALIGAVVAINLLCATLFLLNPASYVPGFELSGVPGAAALRGFGVLFVMWCVPYIVAAWDPTHHRLAVYESVVMQAIGLVGESFIFSSLPVSYLLLRGAILRFIFFDALGLIALGLAALLSRKK